MLGQLTLRDQRRRSRPTASIWFSAMPAFGKRISLTREHFQNYEIAYEDDQNGGVRALTLGNRDISVTSPESRLLNAIDT
ncbi:MAG: hypothetical protein JOZ78_03990 [Chroococcidiopsidaceae cyanobacterium CP_BM_ER_R8_30]|nr:hypothetical protein [Chroococcidiopsidaceae cyanobacterium CP_BM_ER_R8_30]